MELAEQVGRAMGKEVIVAADGPGFLVNRCGRPFNGEGLRLLQERVATARADRPHLPPRRRLPDGALRADGPGGHRRGLRGGEVLRRALLRRAALAPEPDPGADGGRRPPGPEDRPRLLRVRGGRRYRPDDPEPPAPGGGDGMLLTVLGDGPRCGRACASAPGPAGYELREGGPSELVLDARIHAQESPPGGAPVAILCASTSLAARGEPGAVGFHLLPDAQLVELTRLPGEPGLRGHGAGGVLREARLRDRVGRGRARAGARADRLPARQRGGLRHRRGRRLGGGRGHRPHARALPPARARSRGARPSASSTCWRVLDGLWNERHEERYRRRRRRSRRAARALAA